MSGAPYPVTTRDMRAGEHTFRLHTRGNPGAEPVVWLHGSGPGATAWTNWAGVLERMDGDLFHVAPDILGFGDSSHPVPPDTAAGFLQLRADTLLALLDALGLHRVHLVGNSMGGMIALRLAAQAPDRVDRIVLMGSGGAPLEPTPDLIKLVTFYENPTVDALTELLRAMVADPARLGGDLRRIAKERMAMIERPEVRRSHEASFLPGGPPAVFSPDDLAGVDRPVLVVHGREDRIIARDAAYYFGTHIPDAQVHLMPNTGHWTQVEQPDRFHFLAGAFLSGRL